MRLFMFLIFLSIILGGCSTQSIVQTTETTVRDSTIIVVPPAIVDTVEVVHGKDSTVSHVQIDPVTRDTVIYIHYSPVTDTMTIYVRPDTIKVSVRDTIAVIHNEIVEKPSSFVEAMQYLLALAVITGVVIVIMKFVK